jgi:membrane protein
MPIGQVLRAVARVLRRRDLSLHAAAVTFYGGLAIVPVILLTLWLAARLAGAGRMTAWADGVASAIPAAIGADRVARTVIAAGIGMSWGSAVAALVPATLYGEGLRRAFLSLAAPDHPTTASVETLRGWRGRLLLVPLLAIGPGLLVLGMVTLPRATHLMGRGGWAGLAGTLVSFLTVWILLSVVLVWLFRVLGPGEPGWLVTLGVGSFTAANLSGFLHGFLLFCSLPLDIGYPFGGLTAVGGAVAVLLWLYLFHTVTLVGYVCCRQADAYLRGARPG